MRRSFASPCARMRIALGIALACAAAGERVSAQADASGAPHVHADDLHAHGAGGSLLCAICPASRDGSGTSWQPDLTGDHQHQRAAGAWLLRVHAQATLAGTNERGRRGDESVFTTNHIMAGARRPAGGGVFGVQSMWSLEPLVGPRGYPLLLQTGETADGSNPLIDRQHPHDFPMELAVTYSKPTGDGRAFYFYVAAVGAPALGPPPFMHRGSASALPIAPITHHWFDSTHISYGVVTAGFIPTPKAKFELSAFRGREADQHRWGFERPGLDSFAVRVSINPVPSLSLQVSAGHLEEPEPLHPRANVGRLSASAMYAARWRAVSLDAMVAWARNNRSTSLLPVEGGSLLFPGAVSQAVIGEATTRVASRHALIARVERARKDELFGLSDPRHNIAYPIGRVTAGYTFDVVQRPFARVALGAAVSWVKVSREIRSDYGGPPASWLAFLSIGTH